MKSLVFFFAAWLGFCTGAIGQVPQSPDCDALGLEAGSTCHETCASWDYACCGQTLVPETQCSQMNPCPTEGDTECVNGWCYTPFEAGCVDETLRPGNCCCGSFVILYGQGIADRTCANFQDCWSCGAGGDYAVCDRIMPDLNTNGLQDDCFTCQPRSHWDSYLMQQVPDPGVWESDCSSCQECDDDECVGCCIDTSCSIDPLQYDPLEGLDGWCCDDGDGDNIGRCGKCCDSFRWMNQGSPAPWMDPFPEDWDEEPQQCSEYHPVCIDRSPGGTSGDYACRECGCYTRTGLYPPLPQGETEVCDESICDDVFGGDECDWETGLCGECGSDAECGPGLDCCSGYRDTRSVCYDPSTDICCNGQVFDKNAFKCVTTAHVPSAEFICIESGWSDSACCFPPLRPDLSGGCYMPGTPDPPVECTSSEDCEGQTAAAQRCWVPPGLQIGVCTECNADGHCGTGEICCNGGCVKNKDSYGNTVVACNTGGEQVCFYPESCGVSTCCWPQRCADAMNGICANFDAPCDGDVDCLDPNYPNCGNGGYCGTCLTNDDCQAPEVCNQSGAYCWEPPPPP